ncbi:MAG: TspB protein [Inoviridae sp.]|nr:MAG: TspB protein [Inoviridae sp.]
MQKALLLALTIGAFLFSSDTKADDAANAIRCVGLGGTFQNHHQLGEICSVPAPSGEMYMSRPVYRSGGFGPDVIEKGKLAAETKALGLSVQQYTSIDRNSTNACSYPNHANTHTSTYSYSSTNLSSTLAKITMTVSTTTCTGSSSTSTHEDHVQSTGGQPVGNDNYCPSDNEPLLNMMGDEKPNLICYAPAPVDEEEEPPCDDIVGNCEEPDPFQCFLGGNGMEVCFADPNEKCDANIVNGEPVFSNCQAGCGFVNDNFVCSDTPDIPDLDNCIVTTNGYACEPDIKAPDDNIDDPTKPLPDMVKNDFKDVLKGVETRQDITNDLLKDQTKRNADNTNKLAGLIGEGNKSLKNIDDNTGGLLKDFKESMFGDADDGTVSDAIGDIKRVLGITGEESIDDLTVAEITLDEFKSDFSWTIGSTQCPAPRQINILRRTIYMEWEPICEAFNVLGYLVLAAAYFMAAMIAFGGRK